jgi:hypothetical protein
VPGSDDLSPLQAAEQKPPEFTITNVVPALFSSPKIGPHLAQHTKTEPLIWVDSAQQMLSGPSKYVRIFQAHAEMVSQVGPPLGPGDIKLR